MSAFEFDRPRRKLPIVGFLVVIVVIGLVAGGYYLAPRFERSSPQIRIPDSDVLGLAPVEIAIGDEGAGLKSVTATLSAGGTEHTLVSEQYAQPVSEKKFTVVLDRSLPASRKGPRYCASARATPRCGIFSAATRPSSRKNSPSTLRRPRLELIADDRYVNFGGVGAIVYKASADTTTSGVKIGDYFFPGFKGQIKDQPDYFLALFAHPYNVPADAKAVLVATDKAGNSRQMALVYELKNVKYRKSTIAIPESFLQNKVAPLVQDVAARQGAPKDVFIAVNKKLRAENEKRITEITSKATPSMLWKGAFSQLSNSKVEANFADHRTYLYNGEAIDTAYHLGYDLSVTKHYPVEAANSGTVGLRRRPGHLRQYRHPGSRPRSFHALRPPELHRRQGRRCGEGAADPRQDGRDRACRRRSSALWRLSERRRRPAGRVVGPEVDRRQHRAQARGQEQRGGRRSAACGTAAQGRYPAALIRVRPDRVRPHFGGLFRSPRRLGRA